MTRKIISGGNMREMRGTEIKEGHTYYMGASNSPDLVYIDNLTGSHVTIRKYPFYPDNTQKLQRDMAEDLVRQGNQTMREPLYNGEPNPRAEMIGKDVDLKEIQGRTIKFKVTGALATRQPIAVEDKYRNKYGLETNIEVGENTYRTTVPWEKVSEIRELPDIRVLESKKYQR